MKNTNTNATTTRKASKRLQPITAHATTPNTPTRSTTAHADKTPPTFSHLYYNKPTPKRLTTPQHDPTLLTDARSFWYNDDYDRLLTV